MGNEIVPSVPNPSAILTHNRIRAPVLLIKAGRILEAHVAQPMRIHVPGRRQRSRATHVIERARLRSSSEASVVGDSDRRTVNQVGFAPFTTAAHVDLDAQPSSLGVTRTIFPGRTIIIREIEFDRPLCAIGNIQGQTRREILEIELRVNLFGEGKISALGTHTERRTLGELGSFRRLDVDNQSSPTGTQLSRSLHRHRRWFGCLRPSGGPFTRNAAIFLDARRRLPVTPRAGKNTHSNYDGRCFSKEGHVQKYVARMAKVSEHTLDEKGQLVQELL